MQEDIYLIFELNGERYGIRKACVKEIFALPELILISDVPPGAHTIAGIVDLRGKPLPIIDLNADLGHSKIDRQLTDIVITLKCPQFKVGILVNAVHDIRPISLNKNMHSKELQESTDAEKPAIIQAFSVEDEIFILHDPEVWIEAQQILSFVSRHFPHQSLKFDQKSGAPSPNETAQQNTPTTDQEIFRKRADHLKDTVQKAVELLKPIAVVTLGGRFWGIDLSDIREFINIQKVTPVPCCPSHIVGNTNLRGEILTLVDIRSVLNLPASGLLTDFKAMIVEFEAIVVGLLVEEVNDAMFMLNQQDITAVVSNPYAKSDQYLKGIAPYSEGTMGILDLPKLLLKGGLVVDQAI
ncbi:chemotaxis protein CheW [Egbenema bharatensis]|uniref:chemotaxis protein CheW n=1 Tax=Egbenema bharatensis TaxID=3463334 RepID=UPI003A8858A7